MEFSFLSLLNLCGALGLFLFGMSMMSESLQKVAGDKMRAILARMTKNRLMGVLTGVVITSIIQSSSATTVMVVSFVNAGLLSLAESISVIMGANIGTTVTAWLVSLVGFKFNIADVSVPLIGLSIPFLFSKYDKRKSIGQLFVGFALLFIGLEYLKDSMPDINSYPEIMSFLARYGTMGYTSMLVFLLAGTLLTVVLQSSSATMAMTLVMLNQGWIDFESAAAMVLGENIGTTITANLAAIPANVNAKRAALSHTLFNVFGVLWMLTVFYPFSHFVEWIVSFGDVESANPLYALSLFHTLFNVVNVCVMVWFVGLYEKIVKKLIKEKKEQEFEMRFITSKIMSTGELSLMEVEKEIEHYMRRTKKMNEEVKAFALESDDEPSSQKKMARIEQFENASDKTELEISKYLNSVSDEPISLELKKQIRNYLYLVSEIETIADRCYNVGRTIHRRNGQGVRFSEKQTQDLVRMFDLIDGQLASLLEMATKREIFLKDSVFRVENAVNQLRYDLKIASIDDVNRGVVPYASGIYFMDVVEECERLSDSVVKIVKEVRL